MSAVPKPSLTPAEYLARERAATTKSEYDRGEMFAMAGASYEHTVITNNLIRHLGNALDGSACRTVSHDMRVKVTATGLYTYPDVIVVCGPPELEDAHGDTLLNPQVIFEVLSESTERYDRRAKFRQYESVSSLKEYVLVAQDEPLIERYVRQQDGDWLRTIFADLSGVFTLSTVPARVPVADVYRDVTFPESPPR